MNENKLNDKELGQVTGGISRDTATMITCKCCSKKFSSAGISHYTETSGSGCHQTSKTYYQCPQCGKYVDVDGNPHA